MAADGTVRHDWTIDQITALHELPLLELVGRGQCSASPAPRPEQGPEGEPTFY
jgi:hypothetical protein